MDGTEDFVKITELESGRHETCFIFYVDFEWGRIMWEEMGEEREQQEERRMAEHEQSPSIKDDSVTWVQFCSIPTT